MLISKCGKIFFKQLTKIYCISFSNLFKIPGAKWANL